MSAAAGASRARLTCRDKMGPGHCIAFSWWPADLPRDRDCFYMLHVGRSPECAGVERCNSEVEGWPASRFGSDLTEVIAQVICSWCQMWKGNTSRSAPWMPYGAEVAATLSLAQTPGSQVRCEVTGLLLMMRLWLSAPQPVLRPDERCESTSVHVVGATFRWRS